MFKEESAGQIDQSDKEMSLQKCAFNAITDDSGYYNITSGKKLDGEKYKII
jgi:hypothetical protein